MSGGSLDGAGLDGAGLDGTGLDGTGPQLARLPVRDQVAAFEDLVTQNADVVAVLEGLRRLELPGAWLTAGGLFQTVWNLLSGRAAAHGIVDYDVFYFDDADLSWDAEDAVLRRAAAVFGALVPSGLPVQVRNEARVHLWYEQRFGVPCSPFTSSEAAVDAFPAMTCCVAVRPGRDGRLETYAPHGFADLFRFVLRPNPVLAPRSVYEAKAARWAREWPQLRVLDWPTS